MNAVDPRMIRARTALIMSQPFFGTLALYLKIIEDESIETMATDGDSLIYAPMFLLRVSEAELQGVVAHEVHHCAYKHHLRRGTRDPKRWNVACDYVVNRDLIRAGFTLPKDALLDSRYDGMGAEEVYARLPPEPGQQSPQSQPAKGSQASQPSQGKGPQSQPGKASQPSQGTPGKPASQGSPSQSQGTPSQGTPGKPSSQAGQGGNSPGTGQERPGQAWGAVLDGVPSHSPGKLGEAEAEWDRRVRQAIAVAKNARAGKVPGFLEELVTAINKPMIDWREQLIRFVNSRSRFDYAWSRPNRRMLSLGYSFPGVVPKGVDKIGIVIDTSISIDLDLLAQFIGELQSVMDEGGVEQIVVVHCDTKVQKVQQFAQGDTMDVKPLGRGDTKFGPALKWFDENEPDVAALIYFTDLESDDYGEEPTVPLLWAAYGMESRLKHYVDKVPFGEVIKVLRQ